MTTTSPNAESQVQAVRRFNRFYTKQVGALNEGLLHSTFSLTEARVLYELANREQPTATEIAKALNVNAGYLSRIFRDFKKRGLITKTPSTADGRQSLLRLTAAGKKAFASLNTRSHNEVEQMLQKLSAAKQRQLLEAMGTIESLLDDQAVATQEGVPYILRPPEPGDMGWVIHRHGALYAREYGWNEQFEALVALIAAKFVNEYDPKRERCWIAERGGEIVGSVFLVKHTKNVAQLRLLFVEPTARGLGIGARLVSECIRFARQAGYKKIKLWTNDVLHSARKIYQAAGFQLVQEGPYNSFGHDLVEQTWELDL